LAIDPAALSDRGRAAARTRDWATVRACAAALLQVNSEDPEGHFLAGLAARGLGDPGAAAAAFGQAIASDPARYDAAIELAEQQRALGRHADALKLLDRYQARLVNSPMYLDLAGMVYSRLGLPERAAPLLEAANRLQPGVERLQANLAECWVYLGRLEEAAAICSALLERFPQHQRYHYQLANLRRARDDAHLKQMQAALAASPGPPARNIFLYYAIGKALEDLERWDEAFAHYKLGGDAAKAAAGYRVEPDLALIERVIETCDRAWLEAGPTVDPTAKPAVKPADSPAGTTPTPTPIFIVGLPRTGTTLAERILSSHSQVESAGESFYLQMALQQVAGAEPGGLPTPATLTAAARCPPAELAHRYLEAISIRLRGKPYFIEKLPENFLYLGFIARAFPDARLLYLRRHPMDACFALYKQSYFRYAYTLDDLGRYYLAHDRLLRHWRAVLGERLVELDYEALVSRPETEIPALLERLGLAFEPACMEFERNRSAVVTASAAQVREGMHTRSVGKWRRFTTQLEPLRARLAGAGIPLD
jgi:tetratricopeptide (TPR) repeat protein